MFAHHLTTVIYFTQMIDDLLFFGLPILLCSAQICPTPGDVPNGIWHNQNDCESSAIVMQLMNNDCDELQPEIFSNSELESCQKINGLFNLMKLLWSQVFCSRRTHQQDLEAF